MKRIGQSKTKRQNKAKSECVSHYISTQTPEENESANLRSVIVRATPLGTGFVDIFIGQIHSESDDQIQ